MEKSAEVPVFNRWEYRRMTDIEKTTARVLAAKGAVELDVPEDELHG